MARKSFLKLMKWQSLFAKCSVKYGKYMFVLRRTCCWRGFTLCSPEKMGLNVVKRNAGLLTDDVRRDIVINFMLT